MKIYLFCVYITMIATYSVLGCQQSSDCAHNDCCVLDKSSNIGVCKPMGDITARCYVNQPYAYTRPMAMVTDYDMCPCRPGNICGAINSFDSVYGQRGICSFGK